MRLTIVLFLFGGLLLACGGNEGPEQPTTESTQPAGPETPPAAQPEKPKAPPLSAVARQIGDLYQNARRRRGKDKIDFALKTAEQFDLAGTPADAYLYIGLLYQMAQDYGRSADALIKFADNCPLSRNLKTALYSAVYSLYEAGRAAEGSRLLAEHERKFPTDKRERKDMNRWIGSGLLLEGHFDKAVPYLAKAAEMGDNLAARYCLQAYWAQGKYDEARRAAATMSDVLKQQAALAGHPAARIEVQGWSGHDDFDVDSLAGKVYLVYFWRMPQWALTVKNDRQIAKLWERYRKEGFFIVGLSKHERFDPTKTPHLQKEMNTEDEIHMLDIWAAGWKDKGFTQEPWRLGLCGDDRNFKAYGHTGNYPHYALVGKKGNLRFLMTGYSQENFELLAKIIEKLLDE